MLDKMESKTMYNNEEGDWQRKKKWSEVKLVENISKSAHRVFWRYVLCKRNSLFHINCKTMHMSYRIFSDYRVTPQNNKKLPESIESSKFVSHRERISGEFVSKKDSHSTKLEPRPAISVKLWSREVYGSKLLVIHPFDNIAIIHWIKTRLKIEK